MYYKSFILVANCMHVIHEYIHSLVFSNLHYLVLVDVQRSQTQVWLDDSELREQGLGLLVGDRWVHDDIISWNPVNWSGDSVLVASLQRVQNSQHLSGVSTSRSRVGQDQSDLLGWVNDEHRSDGELNTLVVDVSGVLVVNHVVRVSNLSLWVGNNWERQLRASDLINVSDPSLVRLGTVGRQTNELGVSLLKLWLQLSESTQLSGTDWSEVIWVGEENGPRVANVLVEGNWTVRSVGGEVWGGGAQSQGTRRSRHVAIGDNS